MNPPLSDQPISAPCSVCGERTQFACSDCKIDTGRTIHVCGHPACQSRHDRYTCSAKFRKRYPGQPATHSEPPTDAELRRDVLVGIESLDHLTDQLTDVGFVDSKMKLIVATLTLLNQRIDLLEARYKVHTHDIVQPHNPT